MAYTVFHQEDERNASTGLSLEEAATALLTYDGHDFEIRSADDGCFELWHTPFSRNGTLGGRPMVQTVIYSIKTVWVDAEADIFEQVIDCGHWAPMIALPDAAYLVMLSEFEAEGEA